MSYFEDEIRKHRERVRKMVAEQPPYTPHVVRAEPAPPQPPVPRVPAWRQWLSVLWFLARCVATGKTPKVK